MDDELVRFGLEMGLEGRVLLADASEDLGDLVFVAASLGHDGEAVQRRRIWQRLVVHVVEGMIVVQHIAQVQLLDLGDRSEVTRNDFGHGLALFALELEEVPEPNGLLAISDEELVARLHGALVNPTQAQFAEVRVRGDVEHAREERFTRVIDVEEWCFVVSFADEERAWVPFGGARKMPHDDVEQRLDACAAQGVRKTDRNHVRLIHGAFKRLVKRFVIWLFALEVSLHERVVNLDNLIEELGVKAGDWANVAFALAVQKAIDDRRALVRGQVDRKAASAKRFFELVQKCTEVCNAFANVADHDGNRQLEVAGELQQAPGHAVDPTLRVHHEHHRLGGGKAGNRLSYEIRRTRKVENVDALPLVSCMQERRVHGVVVRLLFFLEVASRGARVDVALATDFASAKQEGFGQGGFSARARAGEENVVKVGGVEVGHGPI